MRLGAFELKEPIPELKDPVAFAILRPWIDVNNVGSLVMKELEVQCGAIEFARLRNPGRFFDFSRYRPVLYFDEQGIRRLKIPNTIISYSKNVLQNDFLFLRLLEPHSNSEIYVESILKILKRFNTKRYCLLGSMLDAVPHTKPLIVNGGAFGKEAQADLKRSGALQSKYQGPTTITYLISQKAPEFGIETMVFVVSLPQYIEVEEDYLGKLRLMEILNLLFQIPINKMDYEKAAEQRNLIDQKVERSQELKNIIPQLEALYELRIKRDEDESKVPSLSPEIEEFLWKMMGKDFGGKA
jgi:hypothetical protein